MATWCYYNDKGINENGDPLEIIDAQKNELHKAARKTEHNCTAFLEQSRIFGNLSNNKRFKKEYGAIVQNVYENKDIRHLMHMI